MASNDTTIDVSSAWRAPLGAVSPLWPLYCAAAGAGVAWWWARQWTGLAARAAPDLTWPGRVTAEAAPVLEAAQEAVDHALAAAATIEAALEQAVAELEAPILAAAAAPRFAFEDPMATADAAAPAAEVADEPAPATGEGEASAATVEIHADAEAYADDLTLLRGVGPKLAGALAARGITRFAEIAAWTAADLAEIDQALALKGRAVREDWVVQARALTGG